MYENYKFKDQFATTDYLQIERGEYLHFLQDLPITTSQITKPSQLGNGEFSRVDVRHSFCYNQKEYDVYLHSGKGAVGTLDDYKTIPLPSQFDESIKKAIINEIITDKRVDPQEFLQLEGENIRLFIESIMLEGAVDEQNFSKDQVLSLLIKLQTCYVYVRRKGLIYFHPVSWPLLLINDPISVQSYLAMESPHTSTK